MPYNPQDQQEHHKEYSKEQEILQARRFLEEHGENLAPLNAHASPQKVNTMDFLNNAPAALVSPESVDSTMYYRFLEQANRDDGNSGLADEIANESMNGKRKILPGDVPAQVFHPIAEAVRLESRNLRSNIAIGAVEAAGGGAGFWRQTLQRMMGSNAAQLAQGGAEPLARAQQVLYGLLKGEGTAAFQRLFPKVTLEDERDEFGVPIEISPWAATIDVVWAKMRNDDEAIRDNLDILRKTNVAYSQQGHMVEFRDVVDNAFGQDNTDSMDAFYESMYDAGVMGKIAMGATALVYAAGEMFVDPLIIFDFLPGLVTKAGKGLASTAKIAELSAKVARKTRRLPDMLEARMRAERHLDVALAEHAARPTEKSAANLTNAMNLFAERVDEVEWKRRQPIGQGGDQFDAFNHTGVGKRNPSTIETTELYTIGDEVTGGGTAWERGMLYDEDRGRWIDVQSQRKPVEVFRAKTGDQYNIRNAGRGSEGEHGPLLQSLAAFGEKLGIRLMPFQSPSHKTDPVYLRGQYWPGSRTIWLNTLEESPHQILTTFMHEAWHHIFYTYMTDARKADLVGKMADAGFDFNKYADDALSLKYNLGGIMSITDESTARALSDMASDPEFWDTMRRIDPEAFEALSKSAEDLSLLSMDHIDRMAGILPRHRMGMETATVADMFTSPASTKGWEEYTLEVMGAIEDAYSKDPILLAKHKVRIEREVTDAIATMTKQREGLQALGKKTPMLDQEIKRAEKYLGRLDSTGNRGRLADFKWKAEALRRRTPAEIRNIIENQRKVAAVRSTETVQPNRQPTWSKNLDGEWEKGVYEEQGLFADDVADRLANGPDDAEYAADGLARLVHGADPDDILHPTNMVPERHAETGGRIVPGTKDNMIDNQAANDTLWKLKQKAKDRNLELWEYDSGAVFLEEALNALKKAEPPKRMGHRKSVQSLNELDMMPPEKGVRYRDTPYDPAWLPEPRKKNEQIMADGWWDDHQMNNFDRIASGMYPHTWRVKWPAGLRAGVMHLREPMRVLEDIDPGRSWPLVRGALYNAESETQRLHGVFNSAMERFGSITVKDKSSLRKRLMSNQGESTTVNEELSELLFDILDTSTSDANYAKLTADLSPQQRKAVSDIRHELDLIGDRLGITGTDAFIDGYIHHAFDPTNFSKGQALPEFAGMTKSGNVFLGALLKRNGEKGFVKDAHAALEVYARGVSRKLHVEPALKQFKARATWYANRPGGKDKFFGDYADMMIAQLNGEPSMAGRVIDKMASGVYAAAGKPYQPGNVSRGVLAMNNLIYTSLLAGNRRYPIMAIATALSTTSAKYGMFRTVKAMFKMATPEGQLAFRHMNVDKQFGRIFESDLMNGINKLTSGLSNVRPMSLSTQDSELFIRGMTFWASIDDNLTKLGYSKFRMADEAGFGQEVLFEAMRQTEEINHYFGVLGKSPALGRMSKSGSALATQFLSFPFKQSETLIALGKDDPGNIVRFMMASGWVGRVAAQELGMDVQEYVGFSAAIPRPNQLTSPGVTLLSSMIKMSATMSDFSDGYATAEDAKQSVDQFLKDSEVLIPMLRLAREVAQAAEMDATGRKETPGRGFGREIDAEYTDIGGRISIPLPSGAKGERSETTSILMGSRSITETLNMRAKQRIRQVVNKAAIERMSLVEKAKQAMDSGDWNAAQKQMEKMAEMGFPIGDSSNPVRMKMEIDMLDWYITEMRRNPKLAHKIIPILQEYGILGDTDAQNQ